MARIVAFWVAIAALVSVLLLMAKPFFEIIGFIVMAIGWIVPQLREVPWWTLPYLLLSLAIGVVPLVWVGRLLIQAYRYLH